jgi:hypothetical protein
MRSSRARRQHHQQLTPEQLWYRAGSESDDEKTQSHHGYTCKPTCSAKQPTHDGLGGQIGNQLEMIVVTDESSDEEVDLEVLEEPGDDGRLMNDMDNITQGEEVLCMGIISGDSRDGLDFDPDNTSIEFDDEYEAWAHYNEEEELLEMMTQEEKMKQFDDMMKASEDAEFWTTRAF